MSLPKPIGKQKEVLDLPEKGHYIVLGTAGSGKTTLAIYRAAYLANLNTEKDEKVLLVTFNKSLVTYLNSISDTKLSKVDVRNYHRFARGYLSSRGKLSFRNDIVPSMDYSRKNTKLMYIEEAKNAVIAEVGSNSTLLRLSEVYEEEINWIERMGIKTLEDYIGAERIGRSKTRITRDKREYFFKVYEKYIEIRNENGYKYDWDDIASAVIEELNQDNTKRLYKHIIIDEGQDLSPTMLKSLVLAIPANGSLTFFGDVAQQIYGSRISWRDAGINVSKENIWMFSQNYRNSKEIAKFALEISELPYYKNKTDFVEPKFSTASAPLPALAEFEDEEKEIQWVINYAKSLANTQTVAILVRDRQTVKNIKCRLNSQNLNYQELNGDMSKWISIPGISIGTYHSAKGLEFDAVLLPYCNSKCLPSEEKIIALEGREEALSEEIKLIYVAVTRAKRALVLTYTGKITELIPKDNSLYTMKKLI
ncbi:3'-5' exonuclease [Clostridium saccharoperbutylacetonicum]|uniref:3'-5' exonuclease n=1 Tax=Clostridium saccharoperbutylacetonicum TaxID=36745 RepID=UPI0039E8A337